MFTRSYSEDRVELVEVILLSNVTSEGLQPLTNGSEGSGEVSTSLAVQGSKGTVMAAIILGAVCGNVLVMAAVIQHERLRGVVTNLFVVSLAAADLLVAILVMPFSASVELSGRWLFGRAMCDFFNANDVLFSTASILHLCCIAMDRYIAILHPLRYQLTMTRRRVLLMLLVTWVASILISYIPVYSQLYTTEQHFQALEADPQSCVFIVNKVYAAVSSSVSFWIPCCIMVFVYARIFREARKQEKFVQSSAMYTHYSRHHYTSPSNTNPNTNTDPNHPFTAKDLATHERDVARCERKRMKREHKAAKTLGMIMGAFILCFLPFFLWYVISTMCGDACPCPPVLRSMLFWVGYFNSCLNPLIYAYFNRDFRSAFQKLLHLHRLPCSCARHAQSASRDTGNSEHIYLNAMAMRLSHSSVIMDNGQH